MYGTGPSLTQHRPTRSLHVLLVDDSEPDRVLAREVFDGHRNSVQIETCKSGERALSYLHNPDNRQPDVVLLDINMPGLSGFQVLQQMKNDAELALIPVVMLSTSADKGDVRRAYTLHASSYLVKSASFEQFIDQVDTFVTYWLQARTIH